MDLVALKAALRTALHVLLVSAGGALVIWSAIWLPTLALQHLAGWSFLDAYLMGAPVGLIVLCLGGIAVITYRAKVKERRGA